MGTFWSKIPKFPSFVVKIRHEKTHQKGGGFHVSKFLLLLVFFYLSFYSLPLLFDLLKPKICVYDEVFGVFAQALFWPVSVSMFM